MKNIVHLKQRFVFWNLKNRWWYQRVFLKYHFVLVCTRAPCAIPYQMLLKCLKIYLDPQDHRQMIFKISWVMDRIWLIHESRGLKPDSLGDIFCKEFIHVIIQYSSKYFSSNKKQRYWMLVFQVLFISFFVCWNRVSFFPFS